MAPFMPWLESKYEGKDARFEKMRPSKERRKNVLDCNVVGSEREDPAQAPTTFPKAHCQAPFRQSPAECQTRDQAPLQGCAIFPLEGIDAAPVASESHGGRGAVALAARILRGFGRCGLRRGTRQAGPDMRGVVIVSTRALAPAFGLRSSALLAPPQRVKASQLAVKQLNAYVEGVFDRR